MTEEFVVLLPPHLTVEARSRLAAERAFEREVLALVAELLGLDPPPVDACHEERGATGTWDWHIVRAWQAASVTIRAIARPIERAATRHGEDIEFEVIGLPPPLRVSAFATLDVRVGGSVRVVVGGCQPERIERARPVFGRHVAVILEALGARP